jgi:hypothetical protein
MKQIKEYPHFFETSILISPGIYRYKYIVDGQWKIDPNE